MTFRRSSPQLSFAVAALALSGLVVCNAQPGGRQRARPIEFSVPRNDTVTTNLNQLMNKPDDLRQWQENLYKSPQSFDSQGSLDGVIPLPVRPATTPATQSKRAKELFERQKDWVFMRPEDLLMAPSVEEILQSPSLGPDGRDKKDLSALERYYGRLAASRTVPDDATQSKTEELFGPPSKSNPRDDVAVHEDPNLPSGLRQAAEALTKLFEPGASDRSAAQDAARANLSDTFGLGNSTLSKEQIQERRKYMDEYHSMVDPTWHPPTAVAPFNPLAAVADLASPAGDPAAAAPALPKLAQPRGFETPADVLNPMLGPPRLPDVNAQALGQTKLTSPLPQIESARVTPAAPSFEAPRRSFR